METSTNDLNVATIEGEATNRLAQLREAESTARRQRQNRAEAKLREAFYEFATTYGYRYAVEAVGAELETIGEHDAANSACWAERATVMYEASSAGEEWEQ